LRVQRKQESLVRSRKLVTCEKEQMVLLPVYLGSLAAHKCIRTNLEWL
jgi:hypothetical protein